ncbi:MAG TPA: glycoside hydrolase family 127 protein [Caldilineaceae bacterium]|nr:glycoside hydrolase family 127 protein [Caldilineaceae bacterium]
MSEAVRYQYHAISFTNVTIDDSFWSPRIETNRTVTIGYDFQKSEETDRITNFDKAAGRLAGDHVGIFFNDSDVFKIIEGAAYSLQVHPDPELDAYLDNLIERIAAAQEADGYLYTARTIAERNGTPEKLHDDREGRTRWSQLRVNHELYNVGHLYEAAVAHYLATGKRSLLDVALKNADLVDSVFGPDKKHDVPGHQEIEIGLVKLYGVTGEERYLRLAKFFLDERGHHEHRPAQINFDNPGYMQDHRPVTEQDEAVGHAVRALYMYSGMADVAALTGEQSYIDAIDRIWENVVGKKLYITGGLGARHHGEAFGDNYELPNATAYNETCAAIANVFWNQRMFQLHGDGKYIDVLERSLYNGFLPGVDFRGDKFFYVNPLEFDGESRFNRDNSRERLGWFNCSCCPTNVVRVFPSLGGYIYAQTDAVLYVNLFIASQTTVTVQETAVQVTQQTNYPWDGKIRLQVEPAQRADFTLCLRIPGWAQSAPVPSGLYYYFSMPTERALITVNGDSIAFTVDQGYAHLTRTWHPGDVVELTLPMEIKRVMSHVNVRENDDKVALERGPLVYCAEAIDNGGSVLATPLTDDAVLTAINRPDLLNDVTVIQAQQEGGNITLIPYYAWAHRGIGEMTVWFNRTAG